MLLDLLLLPYKLLEACCFTSMYFIVWMWGFGHMTSATDVEVINIATCFGLLSHISVLMQNLVWIKQWISGMVHRGENKENSFLLLLLLLPPPPGLFLFYTGH
jgi:hypothetical protein